MLDLELEVPLWKALASSHRRRLLDLLCDGPRTTSQLSEGLPELSRFAVMQHLDVLETAGLVLVRREGRQRFNHLNPLPLQAVYERWVRMHSRPSAAAAMGLKRFVEGRTEMEPIPLSESLRVVRIEMELPLAAPAEKVFAAFTTGLDDWWAFRFRPESTIVCEPWVGGRIYEDWGDGNGALYGNITHYEAGKTLISSAVSGLSEPYMALNREEVEPQGDSCIYRKSLTLWGVVPDETERMFRDGTRAIVEQLLRAYVEDGKTYSPPA